MDGAGHKLLTSARLSKHQNACRCFRNDFYKLFQFFGRRGLANDNLVYRAARHNIHPPKQQSQTIGVNILDKHSEVMPSLSKF